MLSVLPIFVTLIGIEWYLIFVLIFISPMMYDMEHLLICLFVTDISFSNVSVKVFDPFLNQVVFLFSFKSSLYILVVLYQMCKYFLSVCGLSFHSVDILFGRQKFLILMKSRLPIISFVCCAFGVSKNSLPYSRLSRFSTGLFSRSFTFCLCI